MKEKILVIDDTQANIEVLLEILSEKYDVMAALDGKSGIEIALEDKPELILLDVMMPEMDGYEVCKVLKGKFTTAQIPIVFLTAKTDEESIECAYDIGASDYVSKPFKPKELLARVNKEIKVQQLISSLEKSQEELKLLSSIDHMTKLYNRRYFSNASEYMLELAKRNKSEMAVVMLDIDKFKGINDTYGHKIGDEVIINLAIILKKFSRKSDVVCRWGGEEFLILLPETSRAGALKISESLREKVEGFTLFTDDDTKINFTISIGVSCVDIKKEINLEMAIHRADEALYEAKKNGRNRVCINKLPSEA